MRRAGPVPSRCFTIGRQAARARPVVVAGRAGLPRGRDSRPDHCLRPRPPYRRASARRAAALGAASGISWGFLAVIKEFSTHLETGVTGLITNWSVYVLTSVGAATLLLASHALASGPLAASQPGFTILDPLSATLLGLLLFGEHIQTSALHLAGVTLGLALLIAGVTALSHGHLIAGQDQPPPPAASQMTQKDPTATCGG